MFRYVKVAILLGALVKTIQELKDETYELLKK